MSSRSRPEAATQPRALRFLVGVVALLVAFNATRALTGPDPSVVEVLPPSVAGRWVTDDARYADRGFTVSLREFHLSLGEGDVRTYPVSGVRAEEADDGTVYDIEYVTPDGVSNHVLTVRTDGTAVLANPADVVWRRESATRGLQPGPRS